MILVDRAGCWRETKGESRQVYVCLTKTVGKSIRGEDGSWSERQRAYCVTVPGTTVVCQRKMSVATSRSRIVYRQQPEADGLLSIFLSL